MTPRNGDRSGGRSGGQFHSDWWTVDDVGDVDDMDDVDDVDNVDDPRWLRPSTRPTE